MNGFVQITAGGAAPGPGTLFRRMRAAVRGCRERLAAWMSRFEAERRLASLSDRALRDLGMHRSEIASVLDDAHGERRRGARVTSRRRK